MKEPFKHVTIKLPVPLNLLDEVKRLVPEAKESDIEQIAAWMVVDRDLGMRTLEFFQFLHGKKCQAPTKECKAFKEEL